MQAQSTPERKYALTKIAPGDYIFPANDGETIWRIVKYTDGPSSGIDDWTRDREVWGVWRWTGRVGAEETVDTQDWDRWEMVGGGFDSRAAAIGEALRIA